MALRTCSIMMSWPSGFNTRRSSRKPTTGLGTEQKVNAVATVSKLESGNSRLQTSILRSSIVPEYAAALRAARSSIFGLISMETTCMFGGKNLKSLPVPAATISFAPRILAKSRRLCGPIRRSSAKLTISRVRLAASHLRSVSMSCVCICWRRSRSNCPPRIQDLGESGYRPSRQARRLRRISRQLWRLMSK
jgi:hypothetical protein